LLYDNEEDPYQECNLVDTLEYAGLQKELDHRLWSKLEAMGDQFLPGMDYIRQWNYSVNETGTVPYTP
jgi:hypothetical protein